MDADALHRRADPRTSRLDDLRSRGTRQFETGGHVVPVDEHDAVEAFAIDGSPDEDARAEGDGVAFADRPAAVEPVVGAVGKCVSRGFTEEEELLLYISDGGEIAHGGAERSSARATVDRADDVRVHDPGCEKASTAIGVTARRTAAILCAVARRLVRRRRCRSQVRLLEQIGRGGDLSRGAAHHNITVIEDRYGISDLERQADVLLDEYHRTSVVGRDLSNRAEQALDDDRCKPHAQFVDEQDLRSLNQGSRHGEHLLLAARKRAGAQLPTRLERGEEREH